MCLDAQATFRAGMEGWLKRMAALYSSERERRTFLINNLHHILGRYGEAALTEGPDVVRETIFDPRAAISLWRLSCRRMALLSKSWRLDI